MSTVSGQHVTYQVAPPELSWPWDSGAQVVKADGWITRLACLAAPTLG